MANLIEIYPHCIWQLRGSLPPSWESQLTGESHTVHKTSLGAKDPRATLYGDTEFL